MKTDIVCGKQVDSETAIHTVYGDRPYYFCSEKCEAAFVGNPINFVDKSRSSAGTEGSPKTLASGKIVPSES